MAIDLTVSLTDQEQARLESIAAEVAPGVTGAALKAWAETEAKEGLRKAVIEKWQAFKREEENTARRAAETGLGGAWDQE